jgi:hypothetical protein
LLLPQGNRSAPGEYWELRLKNKNAHWQKRFWTNAGPSWLNVRATAYDATMDRLLILARDARLPFSGQAPMSVWAVSLEGAAAWRELPQPQQPPLDREDFSLVFDTRRSQFVLFGGWEDSYRVPRTDVWRLDVRENSALWTHATTQGDSIAGHADCGAIYDALRDRLVLFGGARSVEGGGIMEPSDDILTLSFEGNRWTVAHTGLPFDMRGLHAKCLYDAENDRMLVAPLYRPLSELSLDDLSTWIDLEKADPEFRPRHLSLESSKTRAELLGSDGVVRKFSIDPYSGLQQAGPPRDALGTKGSLSPGGPSFPQGLDGSLLYWGGFFTSEQGVEEDLWRFSPDEEPHWTHVRLSGELPVRRREAALAYDGRRHLWWMYGGYSLDSLRHRLDDVWSFDPIRVRWQRLDTQDRPPGSYGASLAYDGLRDRLLLFGGTSSATDFPRELRSLDLTGEPRWKVLSSDGARPMGRAYPALVWDPDHDRLVATGGARWTDGVTGLQVRSLRDTWTFDLATSAWDSVETQTLPPLTDQPQFAWYDIARGLVTVVGGERATIFNSLNGQVRVFDDRSIPAWGIAPDAAGSPGARSTPAFDRERDRLFVFSGWNLEDCWILQRNHPVHEVFLQNLTLKGRRGPASIVLLGDPLFDVRNLDLATASLAGARLLNQPDHGPIQDFNGDGLVDRILRFDSTELRLAPGAHTLTFEGRRRDGVRLIGHVLAPSLDGSIFANGDPDAPTDTVRPLAVFASGFERGSGMLRLDLPSRARVIVDVFAVNGRRVASRDLGELDAGAHDLGNLGLTDVSAGVYFVRARAGESIAQTRLISIP